MRFNAVHVWLLALAISVVWFAPAALFLAVAELLLVLAFIEYAGLARASGLTSSRSSRGTRLRR